MTIRVVMEATDNDNRELVDTWVNNSTLDLALSLESRLKKGNHFSTLSYDFNAASVTVLNPERDAVSFFIMREGDYYTIVLNGHTFITQSVVIMGRFFAMWIRFV